MTNLSKTPISLDELKLQAGQDIWFGRPGRYHRITFKKLHLTTKHTLGDATWGLRDLITYGEKGNAPAWTNFLAGFRANPNGVFGIEHANGNGTYTSQAYQIDVRDKHTYTIEWNDSKVVWSIDGKEVHQVSIEIKHPLSGLVNNYINDGALHVDSIVLE